MGRTVNQEASLTANNYIKIAMLMAVVCVAVIFWLVYRLLQLPTQQQSAFALKAAQAGAPPAAAPAIGSSTPTPVPSSGILATANAYPNIHESAALSSRILGVLQRGDQAEVLGRTPDSVWLEIRYQGASSGVGWVSADLMTLAQPVASIPVATSP
jgi:SH3 domain-containing protein